MPYCRSAREESFYFITDGTGSVRLVVDEDGDVVASYDADEFGNSIFVDENGASTDQRWVGGLGYKDETAATGLYYLRQRYYDAGLGRFVSRDPSGNSGGLNLFAYVSQNPINLVDPSGLQDEVPLCGGRTTYIGEFPGRINAEFRNPRFNPATGTLSVDFRFYNGEITPWVGPITAQATAFQTGSSFTLNRNHSSYPGWRSRLPTATQDTAPRETTHPGTAASIDLAYLRGGKYGPNRMDPNGWTTLTAQVPLNDCGSGINVFSVKLRVDVDADLRYIPRGSRCQGVQRFGSLVWEPEPITLMRYPSGQITIWGYPAR